MTTLSTHDTKRSEDVRARLAVLSERPARVGRLAARGRSETARRLPVATGSTAPTEYLLWQTLVGAWPLGEERLAGYATKAVREAKLHTAWTDAGRGLRGGRRGLRRAVSWRRRPCVAHVDVLGHATHRADAGEHARPEAAPAAHAGRPRRLPGHRPRRPVPRRPGQPPPGRLRRPRRNGWPASTRVRPRRPRTTRSSSSPRRRCASAVTGPSASSATPRPSARLRTDDHHAFAFARGDSSGDARRRRGDAARGRLRRLGGSAGHRRAPRGLVDRRACTGRAVDGDGDVGAPRWHARTTAGARSSTRGRMTDNEIRVWAPRRAGASTSASDRAVDAVTTDTDDAPAARAAGGRGRPPGRRRSTTPSASTAGPRCPTPAAPGSRAACTARAGPSTRRRTRGATAAGPARGPGAGRSAASSTSCTWARSPPAGTLDAATAGSTTSSRSASTSCELMPLAAFPGPLGLGLRRGPPVCRARPYGGPAAFQRFVDACHHRGIGVCLDVVYNHLGPSGNYLATFGPYFTDRHTTPWGPAVNLDGPGSEEVRRLVVDNALRWFRDFHLDALRLDASTSCATTPPRHLLAELSDEVAALVGAARPSPRRWSPRATSTTRSW